MKSQTTVRVISFYGLRKCIKNIIKILDEDDVGLYAAQSAFYIILSAVPFLLLLFTAARLIAPSDVTEELYLFAEHIPSPLGDFIRSEIVSLSERPTPAPFSLSALGVLWSSSRGIRAVRRGIRSVYGSSDSSFVGELLGGVVLTAAFVLLIAAVLVFLVFGNALGRLVSDAVPELYFVADMTVTISPAVFSVFLIMFFTFVFRAFTPDNAGMTRYRDHFPGALLATVGWILYSYLFSLFITFFSDASYLYGSLAALMIFMLWLYMIMYILLIGAEFNKYTFMRINKKSMHENFQNTDIMLKK